MTPQETSYYIEGMKRLRARNRLELMDAFTYHMIPERERRAKHRKLTKEAFPENFESKIVKTTDLELF